MVKRIQQDATGDLSCSNKAPLHVTCGMALLCLLLGIVLFSCVELQEKRHVQTMQWSGCKDSLPTS
jgi:uncharacterized membrane protein